MLMLITRAEVDSKRLARSLKAMGVKSMISPLIQIEPLNITDIKSWCFQSVILTSRNAVHALKFLDLEKSIPIYCVGDRTSSTVISFGFSNVYSAAGNSIDLLNLFLEKSNPEDGAVLYLSGEETSGLIERELRNYGFDIEKRISYKALAANSLTKPALKALRGSEICGIFIFSPRSAIILIDLLCKSGLQAAVEKASAYCLSEAVAKEASRISWTNILVAKEPTQESVLELVRQNLKTT